MKCKVCGANYEIESQDYPMRDKDSIECKYCGNTLIEWNAAVIYSVKYISGPTNEKYVKK
jgi:hypothetical protein